MKLGRHYWLHATSRNLHLTIIGTILIGLFSEIYAAPESLETRKGGNFTFRPDSKIKGFVPSASLEDPVYTSHPHHDPPQPHHHHHHHHDPPGLNQIHHEHPPVPLDKVPKKSREGKGFAIDKGPPELQLGVSFTVPFMSLSTESLVNTLTGKSFGDPYSTHDMSSLFKLNVGGLVVAAIVGIAALLFVPSILPAKFPGLFSGGFPGSGFVPTFIDQFMPGLINKPFAYGNYDHPYDPYPNDYAKSDGEFDGRGRALKRGANATGTYSQIFSTVRNAINNYWGEMESCAFHAMCLRGKHATEEKLKKAEAVKSSRHSRRPDGHTSKEDEEDLSSFEHILEAIHGMEGITKNMPIFHDLHKAFKAGQSGRNCTEEYKTCPVTPEGISKAINNMGNYIFNNNNNNN